MFTRITSTALPSAAITTGTELAKKHEIVSVPYRLVFSSPAREVSLVSAAPANGGMITIDPENPVVFLKATWSAAPAVGETRFAKLILEWPGRKTITHVFDAPGDIDDVFEISQEHDHD